MAELPPIEAPTVSAVYAALQRNRRDEDRGYLGMSQFGTEYDRALWYGWRKVHDPEPLDGRRIRLFETGHLEEERLIGDLRAAGMVVTEAIPQTGRQFGVWSIGGWCPARALCHDGAWARTNCRTCLHATPVVDESDAGRWHCARHDRTLTPDEQRRGCHLHRYVPGLVPGEQVDVDEARETVTYRLADGSAWVDGGRAAWRMP